VIFAVIGARLYHVFALNWDYYTLRLNEIWHIWEGGIAIHGAIIGGLVGVLVAKKLRKFSALDFLDAVSPVMLLAQAIGRWGNYFNQEAYGVVTGVPWGIFINNTGKYHHPTFFYEFVLNLVGALILFKLFRKYSHKGLVFMAYLGIYGINRMIVEPIRLDSSYFFSIPIAFLVALLAVVVSAIYFVRLKINKR